MWSAGATEAQIAEALGTTPGSVNVTIHSMRRSGVDLPYRYRVGPDGRRLPGKAG
jgi:biotin operon repressor